ncbi:hypothetical protein ACMGT0_20620 [Pseudomonas sp. RHF3.3-3]|uniref:hypothetical protein n=1 Tax=Pseudomonas sp. RHF3.3-3 TaxID=3396624 RepID=UPI003A857E01
MSKLADSLKKGLKAAKDHEDNQKQLQAAFEKLDLTIKNFTKNRVKVVKGPSNLTIKNPADLTTKIKEAKNSKRKYGSIFLYSPESNKTERIADWHQADSNFEFSIVYDGKQVIIDSAENIENALSGLLESPAVGLTLLKHANEKKANLPTKNLKRSTITANKSEKTKKPLNKNQIKCTANTAATKTARTTANKSKNMPTIKKNLTKSTARRTRTPINTFSDKWNQTLEFQALPSAEEVISERLATS